MRPRRVWDAAASVDIPGYPHGLTPPDGAAYNDVFFKDYGTNGFIDTGEDTLSTFGMDVDTASYSITRRHLRDGYLPPPEAVRVEEFVNAFDYNYPPPWGEAFAVHIEGAPSRFGDGEPTPSATKSQTPPSAARSRTISIAANRYTRSRGSQRKPQGRDVDFRN